MLEILPGPRLVSFPRRVGYGMLAVGVLLLIVVCAYYVYGKLQVNGRDQLIHEVARPSVAVAEMDRALIPNTVVGHAAPTRVEPDDSVLSARGTSAPSNKSITDADGSVHITQKILVPHGSSHSDAELKDGDVNQSSVVPQAPNLTTASLESGPISNSITGKDLVSTEIKEVSLGFSNRLPQSNVEPALDASQIRPPATLNIDAGLALRASEIGISPYRELEESDFDQAVQQPLEAKEFGYQVSDHLVKDASQPSVNLGDWISTGTAIATRMLIPRIHVNSKVDDLAVDETRDSRSWETPKHVVGHIPTTAGPGSGSQGWYFGHLQSPIQGEGSVFRRLPELAERFKKGENFQISLDAEGSRFVYQVYRTEIVRKDDLVITDSSQNDITLVSCWPELIYNERLLVTAALIRVDHIPTDQAPQG